MMLPRRIRVSEMEPNMSRGLRPTPTVKIILRSMRKKTITVAMKLGKIVRLIAYLS